MSDESRIREIEDTVKMLYECLRVLEDRLTVLEIVVAANHRTDWVRLSRQRPLVPELRGQKDSRGR